MNDFFKQKILGLFSLLFLLFSLSLLPSSRIPELDFEDDYVYCTDLNEIVVTAKHPYNLEHMVIGKGEDRDSLIKYYSQAFIYMAKKNDYPPEAIAALFVYECGGFNSLWRLGMNPFSIKAATLEKDGVMKAYDDCGDVPCNFATYASVRKAFEGLERLLNRVYPDAKGLNNKEFFLYLKSIGYHSDNSQWDRINTANQYKQKYFTNV